MSNTTGLQDVRERVIRLARRIEELSESPVPPDAFFPEFLDLLVTALGARAGAVWMRAPGNRLQPICEVRLSETGIGQNAQANRLNDQLLTDVLATGQACSRAPDDSQDQELPSQHMIVLAALQQDGQCVGAVEVFQRPDAPPEARPGYLQFVEQMCGHASRYLDRQQESTEPEAPHQFWEQFEQFVLQLQSSLDLKEVAATAASDGRLLLGCDRLSVVDHRGKKTVVRAISGQDAVNPRANLVRAMTRLASQVIAMREPITYIGRVENLPPQIEEPLANFVQESGSRMVMVVPLFETEPLVQSDDEDERRRMKTRGDRPIGCLVIEKVTESRPSPEFSRRVDLVAEHTAAALFNSVQYHRVFLLPLWRLIGRGMEWFRGRKLAKTLAALAAVVAVVLALVFVPWDYRVEGEGRLMPVDQREVFAPENGEVVDILVEGGKRVEQGQKLIQLRNDDLSARLLATRNDLQVKTQKRESLDGQIQKASQGFDQDEVVRLKGELRQTEIEIEGLTEQLQVLKDRVGSLTVRAPVAGVVATFQVKKLLRDRPVQQGEILLEVMDDTDDWRLELQVEEHRMGHVLQAQTEQHDPELPVEYILATDPETTYGGVLTTLATRAQVSKDLGNVMEAFVAIEPDAVAEAVDHGKLSADVNVLPRGVRRIGAEVRAKINCGKRSLGYVLFGDVIEFCQKYFWL